MTSPLCALLVLIFTEVTEKLIVTLALVMLMLNQAWLHVDLNVQILCSSVDNEWLGCAAALLLGLSFDLLLVLEGLD
jgi:hypothetical protein